MCLAGQFRVNFGDYKNIQPEYRNEIWDWKMWYEDNEKKEKKKQWMELDNLIRKALEQLDKKITSPWEYYKRT